MPLEISGHVLKGEFSRIANEVNDMVKQLNLFFHGKFTRVAREVRIGREIRWTGKSERSCWRFGKILQIALTKWEVT